MTQKKTIGILCGGINLEHEVHLLSSQDIINSIDQTKYNLLILGIDKLGRWHLCHKDHYLIRGNGLENLSLNLSAPIVYLAHGGILIDGRTHQEIAKVDVIFPVTNDFVQDFLYTMKTPFIGPDIYGTIVGRDKDLSKRLMEAAGLPVAPSIVCHSEGAITFQEATQKLGTPLFIKPCKLGSSIGVHKATNAVEFEEALTNAFTYGHKILIEKAIVGKEIEIAVLGNQEPVAASAICEVTDLKDFFSYEAKYIHKDEGKLKVHTNVEGTVFQQIRDAAVMAFKILECQGMARVDFFLQSNGTYFINEINTASSFGKNNTFPLLWAHSGLPYDQLIDRLIELAMNRLPI